MKVNIQHEALFKEKLQNGICLFTGAGFSVLESPSGKKLPVGNDLCKDVISYFQLTGFSDKNQLDYVSEFCPEPEYQSFLRNYFTVSDFNPLYGVLNNVAIKAFITTNIDNIFRLVVESGDRYYIKNIREYGATIGGPNELNYVPLHGDVTDLSSKLYFGKFELSEVDLDNSDLFAQMQAILTKNPVLFWGYSFNDKGVLTIVKRIIKSNPSNIWVQVRPEDDQNKRLFEEKGCNIITADTESLLKWIKENCDRKVETTDDLVCDHSLNKYRLPADSSIATVTIEDYLCKGNTDWYPIIHRTPYERNIVTEAEDAALQYKNIIISGCHFSGKMTALMQLARKVSSPNKFFVQGITKEEAEFIIKRIAGRNAWVFFGDCCNDVEAFIAFAKTKNIKTVGTSDDYYLETVRHILGNNISFKVLNCSEITESEARRMYNHLDGDSIRMPSFKYKSQPDEKYTMFEFVSNNIRHAYSNRHIDRILEEIKRKNEDIFKVIALATYFSQNGSAISYENIAHLLSINVFPDAVNVIQSTKEYLRLYNLTTFDDTEYQDYFVLRSKVFNCCSGDILIKKYKIEYKNLIKWAILTESKYCILRFDVFRRKAFDSALFCKLFVYEEGVSIYDRLYQRDSNPYILQQKALFQGFFGDYNNAFATIDKAVAASKGNFSFRNSRAILLFESNHRNHSPKSIDYMKQAMQILESCYKNDKRKLYHAQKYSEFAILLFDRYNDSDYIETAEKWLSEMTKDASSESATTKKLKEQLRDRQSRI